jgi:hypothetical protein
MRGRPIGLLSVDLSSYSQQTGFVRPALQALSTGGQLLDIEDREGASYAPQAGLRGHLRGMRGQSSDVGQPFDAFLKRRRHVHDQTVNAEFDPGLSALGH